MKQNVIINADLCIGCGACEQDCPQLEFRIVDGKATTVSERCIRCGHCLAICPKGAISMCNAYEESVPIDLREQVDPSVLHNVLYQRRTIRQFRQQDISTDIIADILDAGRVTHTGKNRQGLTFYVLEDQKDAAEEIGVAWFRKIKTLCSPISSYFRWKQIPDDFFFRGAPCAIVIVGEHESDGVFAAANMEYMAEAHGLGVMVSGFFTTAVNRSGKLRKLLDIPKGSHALATLVLGYPKVRYFRTVPRDPLNARYL